MSVQNDVYDLTIIGAGPVGLYGAMYAGKHGLKVKVIDSQERAGGRLVRQFPERVVWDVAGYAQIGTEALITQLLEKIERYDVDFVFNTKVTSLDHDQLWYLDTGKSEHKSKAVIIASGPAARFPVALEDEVVNHKPGKGVVFHISDVADFKGKNIMVVGSGETALKWAISARDKGANVTMVHRLNRMNPSGIDVRKFNLADINMKYPYYEIKEIHGKDKVDEVTIFCNSTGREEKLPVDTLLLNLGAFVKLDQFEKWGIATGANSITVDDHMATSLPGVFAAGDVVTHPGKIKLISVGAGEVAMAVSSAASFVEQLDKEIAGTLKYPKKVMEAGGVYFSNNEAIQIAIILEQDAFNFYQAAFFNAGSTQAKDVFAKLERYKQENIKRLKKEILPVVANGEYVSEDLDDTAMNYLRNLASRFIFGGNDLVQSASRNKGSEMQNLYTGIRIEEDMRSFIELLLSEKVMEKCKDDLENMLEIKQREIDFLRQSQAEIMESPVV